jgi:hypothetical protein
LQTHKNISPNETRCVETMGVILPRIRRVRGGVVALSRRRPAVSGDAVEELEDVTEAVEIQEVIRPGREVALGRGEIIGAAQGEGGMPSVRETDDEIRIVPAAKPDDLDSLAAKRMMGMGDGDESRRRLGGGGSALQVSRSPTGVACHRLSG